MAPSGDKVRRGYRVRFLRDLVNASGDSFESTLFSVDILNARTRQRALAAAMRRFERRYRLHAWDVMAHRYDAQPLLPEATERERNEAGDA
jgi:hypothetical protein